MKVRDLKKRAEAAWDKRRIYDMMLRDVYDYVLPMRDVSSLYAGGSAPTQAEGAPRVDRCFDATAIKAAFRFAGRLQTELTPIFQNFFSIEAGPLWPDDDNKKQITEQLQDVGRTIAGVLASGSFHNSAHEMYVDLYAGTGYMLINPGDDIDIVRFTVVPVPEMAVEEGPWGQIEHWYWKRKWRADELKTLWPNGTYSDKVQELIRSSGEQPVEVCQYTYRYREGGKSGFRLVVWADKCGDDDEPIHTEEFRTSPWISPRFFKVPGEAYGRGPAQLAMPFIKTANKTRELQLKAAAIALMGLWSYRNDGVFNPDTVRFEPRAMWPVASTGGPMGPTLQRLDTPKDFDVSSIVMADEREQMKLALFDDTLPPESGAVRSATEITERMSRLSQDLSGVYGRLTLEIVVPVVQRVADILEQTGKLKTSIRIDQLVTQVRVVAPIAASQQAAKVNSAVSWMQILGMLGGPQAMMLAAKVEDLGPELGRWLGVDEKFIRSKIERDKMQQAAAQAAAQQHQAEIAKATPQQPPQQQLVNGGAM